MADNSKENKLSEKTLDIFSEKDIQHLKSIYINSFKDFLLFSLWKQVVQICASNSEDEEASSEKLLKDMENFWRDISLKEIEKKVSNYNEFIENDNHHKFGVDDEQMPDTEDVREAHIDILNNITNDFIAEWKSKTKI